MSKEQNATTDTPAGSATDVTFDEGRYLYCIVPETADQQLETTGLEGSKVRVVTTGRVGAVCHDCDRLYDSADLTQIKRWLVHHQAVIDHAGERFGTPVPFQFDTILRGNDDALRAWLSDEHSTLTDALEGLADHWEYRIELVVTDPVETDTLCARDDQLATLREQIEASTDGTAFLVEKQFEKRVRELRSQRRESLTADLTSRLDPHVREVHQLERTPSTGFEGEMGDRQDGETLCRLTILAHEDTEEAVGSVLDTAAETPGLEVRFTGPWPPYTFAPALGDETETEP